ncbi:hypothetical protein EXIGLDRAFT_690018 [Exidia glandulosa HHB12029]|uniref:RING-type E3 ubiquitin transferase n=1 Tax=Exidia glandulosa HHB12029 TaxID=1314781 RepID=A0A166MWU5_EXIGL|nr:hypothetical protein EXIGLDRAFT_690018 [Exidia glandulosa HHB12029]
MLGLLALVSIPYYITLALTYTSSFFHLEPSSSTHGTSLGWLAALFSPLSDGAISIVDRTPALTFVARSASFGPRITEDDGPLLGYLIPLESFTSDEDALGCPPVNVEPQDVPDANESWIALVQRGGCGFVEKVRAVQGLGARAVVVGGSRPEPGTGDELLQMYSPGDSSDIRVPSTYVTYATYARLEHLIEKSNTTTSGYKTLSLVIHPDYSNWEWYSPIITFIFLLLLPSLLTLLTLLVHRVRVARAQAADRAPATLVFNLPWRVWGEHGLLGDDPVEKPDTKDGHTVVLSDLAGEERQDAPTSPVNEEDTNTTSLSPHSPAADDESERRASQPRAPSPVDDAPTPTPTTEQQETRPSSMDDAPPQALEGTPAAAAAGVTAETQGASGSNGPIPAWFASQTQCAICLGDFERGDRVRILPCRHVFHLEEVDEWLITRKKMCPVCKADVTLGAPRSASALPPSESILPPSSPSAQISLSHTQCTTWKAELMLSLTAKPSGGGRGEIGAKI